MKTSIKLLIITALSICLLLITGLIVVKNTLDNLPGKMLYKHVEVEKFEKIELPKFVQATIYQGRSYSLEISPVSDTNILIKNTNSTLSLVRKNSVPLKLSDTIFAKITVPNLKAITASEGTKLLLQNFQGDSITIHLKDGSVFTEKNNSFKYKSIVTEGKVSLKVEALNFN